mmetsp:Transcript_20307/g.53830  ORF Transcript_20307/g.53830 Transcript_20307/m.53830 type:complete len:210 (+) Transcript_20307:853-1482(+)
MSKTFFMSSASVYSSGSLPLSTFSRTSFTFSLPFLFPAFDCSNSFSIFAFSAFFCILSSASGVTSQRSISFSRFMSSSPSSSSLSSPLFQEPFLELEPEELSESLPEPEPELLESLSESLSESEDPLSEPEPFPEALLEESLEPSSFSDSGSEPKSEGCSFARSSRSWKFLFPLRTLALSVLKARCLFSGSFVPLFALASTCSAWHFST